MGAELARAMDQRVTRWESRALWSQWYDAAIASGLAGRSPAAYASHLDEEVRLLEKRIEGDRARLIALVNLGADVVPNQKAAA